MSQDSDLKSVSTDGRYYSQSATGTGEIRFYTTDQFNVTIITTINIPNYSQQDDIWDVRFAGGPDFPTEGDRVAVVYRTNDTTVKYMRRIDVFVYTSGMWDSMSVGSSEDWTTYTPYLISYDMTPDISTIVVGSRETGMGVRIYQSTNSYTQSHQNMNHPLDTETTSHFGFGYKIQVSNNGLVLVVSTTGRLQQQQEVNIYKKVSSMETFQPHTTLKSPHGADGSYFGDGLYLNGSGTILYVGETDRLSTVNNGHVFIYDINRNIPFREIRTNLKMGDDDSDEFGSWYLHASEDGMYVLASDRFDITVQEFHTYLYKYDSTSGDYVKVTIPSYEDETIPMYVVSASADLTYFVGKIGGSFGVYGYYATDYRIFKTPDSISTILQSITNIIQTQNKLDALVRQHLIRLDHVETQVLMTQCNIVDMSSRSHQTTVQNKLPSTESGSTHLVQKGRHTSLVHTLNRLTSRMDQLEASVLVRSEPRAVPTAAEDTSDNSPALLLLLSDRLTRLEDAYGRSGPQEKESRLTIDPHVNILKDYISLFVDETAATVKLQKVQRKILNDINTLDVLYKTVLKMLPLINNNVQPNPEDVV
jgi:hypothetical protein